MPGIEKKRFIEISDQDLDEFVCGICLAVFVDPVVTQCCRQTYCSDCIKEWLAFGNSCPNDRKPLNMNQLIPAPRIVTNLMNNLKIKCDFQTNGCKSDIQLNELSNHLHICCYNPNNVCKTCRLNKESDREHNCIEDLITKNQRITDENNRLTKENLDLKQQIESLQNKTDSRVGTNGQRLANGSIDNNWTEPDGQDMDPLEPTLTSRLRRSQLSTIGRLNRFRERINLFVKNLEPEIDDNRLYREFAPFGTITSSKVMTDLSNRSKGFGFVSFSTPEEAKRAVIAMNNKTIVCKPLYVSYAQKKEERREILMAQHNGASLGDRPLASSSSHICPNPLAQPFVPNYNQFYANYY